MFPGGIEGWTEDIHKEFGFLNLAKNDASKGKYQVIARFIMGKSGKLSDNCRNKSWIRHDKK